MKKLLFSLLTLFLLVGMTACGSSESSSKDAGKDASKDVTLTILVEAGSPGEMVAKETKAEFEAANPGVTLVVDAVPYSGIYDKLSTEIKSGNIIHDVATLDVLWLSAFKNGIEPLNSYVTDEMTADFLPTMLNGATLDGELLGMPMWINSKVLMYRTSLFEDADNQSKFKTEYGYDLQVPTTWEEYLDVAAFFTDADSNFFGTAVYGANNGDTVCSWLDHAAQAGAGPLVLDGDNVLIDEQAYVDAANFMKEQFDAGNVPVDSLSNASGEVINYFTNGQLAMMLNWSHFYPMAKEKLGGDVSVAPMIGGSAGVGATTGPWYQSVLKDSENKDIAIEYVKFMYDHNGDYMEAALKIAGRESVYKEYSKVDGNEHLSAVLLTLESPASGNRPNTPYWTEIEQVLADAVHDVIAGDISAENSMAQAKAEIEKIINRNKK
ncbi:extracellular solute-binding protein [Bacillus sp. HMF5848]|uniref:extracellular solute-binding protein n=1 Tax=Bacillus sp. HMF5848 TaxID=2495421 RepID=UPI000F7A87EF|nr:extracellular solute-binding protein [Bacillus sp. HMF5848]RSK25807.1 extracellular solute-binding protein [Bacillus sp. HMF5848]